MRLSGPVSELLYPTREWPAEQVRREETDGDALPAAESGDKELDSRLHGFVFEALEAALPVLVVLYFLYAALVLTLLPETLVKGLVLTLVAVGSGIAHLRLRVEIRKGRLGFDQANPLAGAVVAVALLNTMLHLLLIPGLGGTAALILIVMWAGSTLTCTRWLGRILAAGCAGWVLATAFAPHHLGWVWSGLALAVGAWMAFTVHTARIRNFRVLHLERLAELKSTRAQHLAELQRRGNDHTQGVRALEARGEMDGLWDWDLESDRMVFSPRWKSMLGYAEDDLDTTSEAWLNLIHFHDLHGVMEGINEHLAGKTNHLEAEHRIQQRNGDYRWVLTRGRVVRNGDGKPERIVGSMVDIKLLKKFETRLVHDATHDRLTGLPNRQFLFERLEEEIRHKQRSSHYLFAVIFLDLDHFKDINDSLGHFVGDQMLTAVAGRLRECVREKDIVARFGGDEFVVLLRGLQDEPEVMTIASRIQKALATTFQLEQHEAVTAASLGVAISNSRFDSAEELLRNADIAMYRAKSTGKGQTQVFDSVMHVHAARTWDLQNELRKAVAGQGLELHYQPFVRLDTGRISGGEALVRWHRESGELVYPGEFIPIAEEMGLIADLGDWTLEESCRQNKQWQEEGLPCLKISVNLSARQLSRPEFLKNLKKILTKTGLDPRWLQLEITESALMGTLDATPESLDGLALLGIPLALDDFGTGYSSLSHLRRLRVRTLKMDRSFIADIPTDSTAATLARSIITMAHGLQLSVVAEGVQTLSQLSLLRRFGCDEVQGYLVSRPVPAEQFRELLRQDTPLLDEISLQRALQG